MRNLAFVVLLVGCGSHHAVVVDAGELPDMAQLPTVDAAQPSPDMAWTDLAGGVDIAQVQPDLYVPPQPDDFAQSIPPDMTPPPDMAQCPFIPTCSAATGGPAGCCNHAVGCINGYCVNTTGEYCNTNPTYPGPMVACYGGKACSSAHTCLP